MNDSWRSFDVAAHQARIARAGETETREAHNLETPGSTPGLATRYPAPGGARTPRASPLASPQGAGPLTLILPFPPSTNSDKHGNHHLTAETRAFRERVSFVVRQRNPQPMLGRLAVTVTLYPGPDRRAFDLDNRIKPLIDAVQNAGVFPNDNAIDHLHTVRVPGVALYPGDECAIVTITRIAAP